MCVEINVLKSKKEIIDILLINSLQPINVILHSYDSI